MKRHLSPAEILGMVAIGIVVFSAWLYSILLEFQFFTSVTPSSNPIFPYLGLAFTGIGFALWGIGFLCARKPFTQVITMIMALASGGCAFTIAYMEFTNSGDKRYGLAADPSTYKNALLAVGVMFMLNLVSLALKAIVWRFSQAGTGFFQSYNPDDGGYIPSPERTRYVEQEQPQPKDERTFERRATSPRLPSPARLSGPGFFTRAWSKLNLNDANSSISERSDDRVPVPASPPRSPLETPVHDEWLAKQRLRMERDSANEKERMAKQKGFEEWKRATDPNGPPVEDDEPDTASPPASFLNDEDDDEELPETIVFGGDPVVQRDDETPTHAAARSRYRALQAQTGNDPKAQSERASKPKPKK